MPKTMTLTDSNYNRGMNSVDDPKALPEGQCVEMINAFPGFPLRLRKGCVGKVILDESEFGVVMDARGKPFYISGQDGFQHVFFWAIYRSGGSKTLRLYDVKIHDDGQYATDAVKYFHDPGAAAGSDIQGVDTVAGVDFAVVGAVIYARVCLVINGLESTWMYAIEYDGAYKARAIPTDEDAPRQTLAPSGSISFEESPQGFFEGNFAYGYSITLVRRVGDTPPDVYVPGLIETPERVETRGSVIRGGAAQDSKARIFLKQDSFVFLQAHGFTHVRIYRTDNLYGGMPGDTPEDFRPFPENIQEQERFIAGAPRKFLMDIPVWDWGRGNLIEDTVSDGALAGEMNLMAADQYTFPPADGFRMCYFKDRLWILGAMGNVFFSEIPGGDGGGDVGFAQIERSKYALWFKPLAYRVELDVEERIPATGIAGHGDDLFFFKANKSYVIISGDPLIAPLRCISDNLGCLYGDTATSAKIHGNDALFFMSNLGPVLVHDGGNVRMFTEFKVAELWPDGEVTRQFGYSGAAEYCTAAFWDDAVWVFYKMPGQASKIFAYSSKEVSGALEIRLAGQFGGETPEHQTILETGSAEIVEIETGHSEAVIAEMGILPDRKQSEFLSIVLSHDNKALAITNVPRLGAVAITDFLGGDRAEDKYTTIDGYIYSDGITFEILSRQIYPGPKEMSISELYSLVVYCKFQDYPFPVNPFKIELMSNRHRTEEDFYSENTRFTSNQLGKPFAGITSGSTFFLSTTEAFGNLVDYAAYLYDEERTRDGVYVYVASNTPDRIHFSVPVGEGFNRVRLIGRPAIRLNVQVAPQAGFIGEYFQYRIKKQIPWDTEFKLYGTELQIIPRPNLDRSESLIGGAEMRNSWEGA
jgi:hypothetical protein